MWGLPLCLMLAKPSHPSVIELFDPLGKDGSPVWAWNVERGGPPHIVLIPLGAFGMLDLVVFNAPLECLDLDA